MLWDREKIGGLVSGQCCVCDLTSTCRFSESWVHVYDRTSIIRLQRVNVTCMSSRIIGNSMLNCPAVLVMLPATTEL
jgi:hypothetical protein